MKSGHQAGDCRSFSQAHPSEVKALEQGNPVGSPENAAGEVAVHMIEDALESEGEITVGSEGEITVENENIPENKQPKSLCSKKCSVDVQ